jgi:hypothetical protein
MAVEAGSLRDPQVNPLAISRRDFVRMGAGAAAAGAAIGCHMANASYLHRTVALWDAETKTIKG